MTSKIPEGSTFEQRTTYRTSGLGGLPTFVLKSEIIVLDERESPLGRTSYLCYRFGTALLQAVESLLEFSQGLELLLIMNLIDLNGFLKIDGGP